MASLPALISFSPTLRTRVRPATAAALGYSFLGEGSLDPPPAGGGRESLEALDILQVSGSVKLLSPSQPMVLQLCPMSNPEVSQVSVSVTLLLFSSNVLYGSAGRLTGPDGGRAGGGHFWEAGWEAKMMVRGWGAVWLEVNSSLEGVAFSWRGLLRSSSKANGRRVCKCVYVLVNGCMCG